VAVAAAELAVIEPLPVSQLHLAHQLLSQLVLEVLVRHPHIPLVETTEIILRFHLLRQQVEDMVLLQMAEQTTEVLVVMVALVAVVLKEMQVQQGVLVIHHQHLLVKVTMVEAPRLRLMLVAVVVAQVLLVPMP
jgi:hypothetical protein